ncbi:MAG: ABC transporter ATP-binding protein, partial [Pseudomonadota bacterium]
MADGAGGALGPNLDEEDDAPAPKKPAGGVKISLVSAVIALARILGRASLLRLSALLALMVVAATFETLSLMGIQSYILFLSDPSEPLTVLGRSYLEGMAPFEAVLRASFWLSLVLLVKLALFVSVYWTMTRMVSRELVRLSDKVLAAYLAAPLRWHQSRSSAALLRTITDDARLLMTSLMTPACEFMLSLLTSGAILVYLAITLPWQVQASLGVTIVLIGLMMGVSRRILRRTAARRRRNLALQFKAVQESLGGLGEARILGRTGFFRGFHRDFVTRFARALQRQQFVLRLMPQLLDTLVLIIFLVIVALMLATFDDFEDAIALTTVLAVAVMRLKQTLNKLFSSLNKMSTALPSVGPVQTDLGLAREAGRARADLGAAPPRFETLALTELGFSFAPTDAPALEGVTLTLARGDHLAVAGETGAGKSTLINLLLGLYPPSAGEITVNGAALGTHLAEWRAMVGYVPQTIFIRDASLAENVAFGIPKKAIDRARVEEVLRLVELGPLLDSLEAGLETGLGEAGARLSGGQRQ